MRCKSCCYLVLLLFPLAGSLPAPGMPAAQGQAGTVTGVVTDPSGGAIPNATVTISNPVAGYQRSTGSDANGSFQFKDVPPNNYHLEVGASGFQNVEQDVDVRTTVPISVKVTMTLSTEVTTVEVHSTTADLVESVPSAHTDLDSSLLSHLPLTSPGGGLSQAITLASPGVVADSNGFFHPLGDHADTGFSVDNQPITDQQSKQFSTSMPLNAFQSMEVISGAPAAEFGDKGSLVVNAVTRSALGQKPFGSFSVHYGSFGTVGEDATFGLGGAKIGNFFVVNTVRSGRYLDSPEFSPLHDAGNNETAFDRFDYQFSPVDTFHLNLFFSRAWFQAPNTYDQQVSAQDQRQQIRTFNIAPGWVHVFGTSATLTLSPYYRQDLVGYFPSNDPFADLPATVGEHRRLGNLGIKADFSYVHGRHNIKIGVQAQHTFLTENFAFGITDPGFNTGAGFQPGLALYDLTRGGHLFSFHGHTDIKEEAAYFQDNITLGPFTVQAGLRGDVYHGIVIDSGVEPRLGASYLFKPTSTVFRVSYSRFFETPYNENLILSSATGAGGLAANSGAFGSAPLAPGRRNQYNAGMQQALGKHFVIDASYLWKYTSNAFDFDTLFNSPLTFPIEWRKSKIDGLSARINFTEYHGFTAFTVLGHTRARFFGPEAGGLLFNSPLNNNVFRIDHDQAFQQTTNLRYQFKKNGPWIAFTWRYDSGMVAGSVPDAAAALALTGDEQAAIGLQCGGTFATLSSPITACAPQNLSATRIRIPAPGTENDDTNPARIAPRHLFDVGVGFTNILRTDRPRLTLHFTAANITNQVALYNFLSTFSGTHFVSPRSYTAEIGTVW